MVAFLYYVVAVVVIAIAMDSVLTDMSVKDKESKTVIIPGALREKWGSYLTMLILIKMISTLYALRLIDYDHASGKRARDFLQFTLLYKDVVEASYGADTTKTALTRSEYVNAHGWFWSQHYDLFKRRVLAMFTTIFLAIDTDDDGVISFGEFEDSYNIYGDPWATKGKAKIAFEMYDNGRDGGY